MAVSLVKSQPTMALYSVRYTYTVPDQPPVTGSMELFATGRRDAEGRFTGITSASFFSGPGAYRVTGASLAADQL